MMHDQVSMLCAGRELDILLCVGERLEVRGQGADRARSPQPRSLPAGLREQREP